MVHVDHGEVRLPLGQDRLRLRQAARGPDDEEAVVEGQLDEVHDERAIVEHQGAQRSDRSGLRVDRTVMARPSERSVSTRQAPAGRCPRAGKQTEPHQAVWTS